METIMTGDPWRDKANAIAEMEDRWQQWADVVCDPSTPAPILQKAVEAVAPHPILPAPNARPKSAIERLGNGGRRVWEAVAAHSNAPPQLLADLLTALAENARGFCRNPAAPFLPLEAPDFVLKLPQSAQLALLREADCLPLFVQQMANVSRLSNKSANVQKYLNARMGDVEEAARLHVAVAGELPPENNAWQNAVRDYWQAVCADPDMEGNDEAAELAEIGLAPSWAAVGWEMLPHAKQQKAQRPPLAADYPYLEAWFRYECATGSPEEAAVLALIGPDVQDRAAFARALRASGTADDLLFIAQTETSARGLIVQALIRHPNTDARVLQALAARASGVSPHELVRHEKATVELIVKLMEHTETRIRRMARLHKNAPQDNGETARRAFADRAFSDAEPQPGQSTATGYLSPFASFIASLNYPTRATPARLLKRAESLRWTERMEAVFIASANPDLLRADDAGRTCADLLHHLSRDGNRLVRAAARAYLDEPAYLFDL